MIDIEPAASASFILWEIKIKIVQGEESYDLTINLHEEKISFQAIKVGDLLQIKYLKNLSLEDFYALDKMFKQFDNLSEIFESLREKSEKKDTFNISVTDDNLKLIVKYPSLNENEHKDVPIILVPEILKDNILVTLLNSIGELSNQVKSLKKELNFATNFLNISQKRYAELFAMPILTKQVFKSINSSVITSPVDLAVIESGILNNLNKTIKSMKLLFSTNIHGDSSANFHTYCDHHYNTLTVVYSNNRRRFGGFTTAEWDKSNSFKIDEKAFIFSLDDKNCYYQRENNKGNKAIYCFATYGPVFGGHDFYMCDSCKRKSKSFDMSPVTYDTNGKKYALNLVSGFTVLCYEVYELDFE